MQFLNVFLLLSVVSGAKLRGSETRRAQEASDIELMRLAGVNNWHLQFPDGVYDEEKAASLSNEREELDFMGELVDRCTGAIDDNSTNSHILACHLISDPEQQHQWVPTGPMKLTTNLIDALGRDGYHRDSYSNIFKMHATAAMINDKCFMWDSRLQHQIRETHQFTDSSSYSSSVEKSTGLDVSMNAGYGPVSVNAGYNEQNSNSASSDGHKQFAFGESYYEKPIGYLSNNCFTRIYVEDKLKNLLKQEWVDKWKVVRDETDAKNLSKTQQFHELAMGGLIIPREFYFGGKIRYTIKSTYTMTNTGSSEAMSRAITAGFQAGAGGASAGVQSEVSEAVKKAANDENLHEDTRVEVESLGVPVSTDCFQSSDAGKRCGDLLTKAVASVKEDLNNLSPPHAHKDFFDIVELVKWTLDDFNDDIFKTALSEYFTAYKCTNPNAEQLFFNPPYTNQFNGFDGFGKKIVINESCPGNQRCVKLISENRDDLCKQIDDVNMYNPSTDNCWYLDGSKEGLDIMTTNCYFNYGYHPNPNGLNSDFEIDARSVDGSMPNKICGNRCESGKEWWSGCGEKANCH